MNRRDGFNLTSNAVVFILLAIINEHTCSALANYAIPANAPQCWYDRLGFPHGLSGITSLTSNTQTFLPTPSPVIQASRKENPDFYCYISTNTRMHVNDVKHTSDGGYIVTGDTGYSLKKQEPTTDFLLMKFDNTGLLSWMRVLGGDTHESGVRVLETADGSYFAIGSLVDLTQNADYLLFLKFDGSGGLTWAHTVSTYGTGPYIYSIAQTSDGGFIVAGSIAEGGYQQSVLLMKLDSSGAVVWTRETAGGRAQAVIQTQDGGYAIAGYINGGFGWDDIQVVRYSSSGERIWRKILGGSQPDRAYAIAQTSDGGLLSAGYTHSFGAGSNDVVLVKFSLSGDLEWMETIGSSWCEYGIVMVKTADNGYVIGGARSYDSTSDPVALLIKSDESGTVSWSRTFGHYINEFITGIDTTSDGGLIVTGLTDKPVTYESIVFLAKLEADGAMQNCPYVTPRPLQTAFHIQPVISPSPQGYGDTAITINRSLPTVAQTPLFEWICNAPPPTYTPTPSPTRSPTLTRTVTLTRTRTLTPTRTATPTITATRTSTVTQTLSPTQTPTPTLSGSETGTATPSSTAPNTTTQTPTNTSSPSPTPVETPTNTPTDTSTMTLTPTVTDTPSPTESVTLTPTASETPSITITATRTSTDTQTLSPTQTPTPTLSCFETVTATPSSTAPYTTTQTPTNTSSPSPTAVETPTNMPTDTSTMTLTPTVTDTPSPTESVTLTPTASETPFIPITATLTASVTIPPATTVTPMPVIPATRPAGFSVLLIVISTMLVVRGFGTKRGVADQ